MPACVCSCIWYPAQFGAIRPWRGKHIFKHAYGGHKPTKGFVVEITKS